MNISSFKRDINKAAYRVIQIKEIYDNILNIDNFVDNQQFNIEGLVPMLTSNGKQDILNISLIQDILKNIRDYYANIRISHNFDIILQNQEFLQILIRLISGENDEKIRYYSFIIIFLLISYHHTILVKLVEYGLYKSFATILALNTRFDSLGYFFVSRILHDIFSYPDYRVIEPFLQSPLSNLLIDLLSDTSNMKSIDDIFIKFKSMHLSKITPSEMLPSQKRVDFYKENYFEELIISIIEILYKLFGTPDNDMTHQVVKTMNKLMTASDKKDLTCSVSRCLSTMIMASKYALIQSLKFGLIQSLNMKLDSIEYKFAWSHIIKVDLISLQCILAEIKNPNNQQDLELNTGIVERLLITIRTTRLYNLINYSVKTYEEDEKDSQQKFVSQILNCFAILFQLNPQVIIEEYNDQADRTQVLTLEEFHQLLLLIDDSVIFSLKKKGVLFILSSINYQDCLHSHLEIIDNIFDEYNGMILSVLETSKNPVKKLALAVLINLADKILTTEFPGDGVMSFIKNQELGNLVEEWKYDDDDEIQGLSSNFYNQAIQLFS